ncbi:MAG: tetratricopeptide repeat protein, partial [Proteobacteria bacterium]|nr:tetratricopeptide repeat protein [Pseudomonadota bacterium]
MESPMPHADDQTIAYFRQRSQEIDDLFGIGKKQAGAALLNQTLGEAKEKDAAYFLFFQGEEEGYIHGNRSRQVQFFKEAVKIRNADFFLLRNLGVCLSAKGDEDEAIKLFDRALSLNPEDYR